MSNSTPFRIRKGYENAEIAPDLRAEFSRRGKIGVEKAKANGTHHKFTAAEAARGGAKGGRTRANTPGAMAEMGRKGAQAAAEAKRQRKAEREAAYRLADALSKAETWGEGISALVSFAVGEVEGGFIEIEANNQSEQGGDDLPPAA